MGKDTSTQPFSQAQIKRRVIETIEANRDKLIALSDKIHANPEIGFQEKKAVRWLTEEFSVIGFEVERGIGGLETAFRATHEGIKQRPNLGFIVEYDALPSIGHACGHNTKGPATLGSTMAILKTLDKIPGTITVLGTPAEEGGGGKVLMANQGVFDDLDVAIALSVGPKNMTGLPTLASRTLDISINGRSAHAHAEPQAGRNALSALISGFNQINYLRQQFPADARINWIIVKGGDSVGSIPDLSTAKIRVSAASSDTQAKIEKKAKYAFSSSAKINDCTLNIKSGLLYEEMKLNKPLIKLIEEKFRELELEVGYPSFGAGTGASDMGNVSQVIPADSVWLSLGKEIMPHTKEYAEACKSQEGHTALINAARVGALIMLELLLSPQRVNEIKSAFHMNRGDRS